MGGRWEGIEGKARPLLKLEDNLLDEDPHFVDAEHLNFQLRSDSPAYKLGFERIPVDEIGLYRPSTQMWYLDYDNNGASDFKVKWGANTDTPVTGRWS